MEQESLESSNASINSPKSDANIELENNANLENQQNKDEPKISNERITLTSRRTKKHVTIQDNSGNNSKAFMEVESALQNLEENFIDGVEEIRKSLKLFAIDRESFELHIKSLEESLRKSTQEKEKYRENMQHMKDEITILAAKLEAMKRDQTNLQQENQSLQSDHEDHMKSIADQHRKRLLAKRTFKKWKGKMKPNESSNSKIAELIEENEKLKKELEIYQESAKHAFLRSANALNSEALSLFQNTTTRFMNNQAIQNVSEERKSPRSDISLSDRSSYSSLSESQTEGGKENDRRSRRSRKEHIWKSVLKNDVKRDVGYLSDETRSNHYRSDIMKSHSDNEMHRKPKSHSRIEYVPDPLRKETRQIMKQLETNRKPYSNVQNEKNMKTVDFCNASAHVHICHCKPLPGRSGSCPYCYANQNLSFVNMPMPFESKPKPKSNIKANSSVRYVTGENAKVIYKPSGSTVILEKHLG